MICLDENEYLFKNQAGKKYKTIYADPPWITERGGVGKSREEPINTTH